MCESHKMTYNKIWKESLRVLVKVIISYETCIVLHNKKVDGSKEFYTQNQSQHLESPH